MTDIKLDIFDEKLRLVGGWASVEVVDLQNQVIPVEELKKAMVKFMANGGYVIYGHKNQVVGKVIYWDVKHNENANADGLYVICKIDNSFFGDVVWEKIKKGEIKGFSVGGVGKIEKGYVDGKEVEVLKGIELAEISLVENPANPFARIEQYNPFAKAIRTTDVIKMVSELIGILSGKVDGETLQKVIEIISKYDKPRNGNRRNDNVIERDEIIVEEINEDDDVSDVYKSDDMNKFEKKLRSTRDLVRIVEALIEDAKKIYGFVKRHTQSPAYRGMAEDIVKFLEALLYDIADGIVVVDSEKAKKIHGKLDRSDWGHGKKKVKGSDENDEEVKKNAIVGIVDVNDNNDLDKEDIDMINTVYGVRERKDEKGSSKEIKGNEDAHKEEKKRDDERKAKNEKEESKKKEIDLKSPGKVLNNDDVLDIEFDKDDLLFNVAKVYADLIEAGLIDLDEFEKSEKKPRLGGKKGRKKEREVDVSRYLEDVKRQKFREMTCPDDPYGHKSKFCGCVRYLMDVKGYSLDDAKRICGHIFFHLRGKKRLHDK